MLDGDGWAGVSKSMRVISALVSPARVRVSFPPGRAALDKVRTARVRQGLRLVTGAWGSVLIGRFALVQASGPSSVEFSSRADRFLST